MKIDWQKQYFMKGNNYGLTSLVGGAMQLVFGFSYGMIPLAIFIVTIIAIINNFLKEKNQKDRRLMNYFGIVLVFLAVFLFYTIGFYGIVGSWVLPKYVSFAI